MARFELKTVRHLLVSDLLELAGDVRLFRVTRIETGKDSGRCKLHLRSLDGTRLSLLRGANDQLLAAASEPRPLPRTTSATRARSRAVVRR